jgi:hypothetical protein
VVMSGCRFGLFSVTEFDVLSCGRKNEVETSELVQRLRLLQRFLNCDSK